MLNIYLSCLLHQSALCLRLSINPTFKDSSPPGCYNNSKTKHLHCDISTSALLFFTLLFRRYRISHRYTGDCKHLGGKQTLERCNAVTPLVDVNNEPTLKSPLQSICTRKLMLNIESVLDESEMNDVHYGKVLSWQCAAVAQKMFRGSPNGLNLLIDLHKTNKVEAASGLQLRSYITARMMTPQCVHVLQIPVVFLANK